MLSKLKKSNQGFTIIEVMIVLAIAGLILLIVFLAVPALQRNGRNTTKKQPEPLQPSSDQLEDQVLDTTLRSSPEPEMQKEYTNASNQGPNQNPAGKPPAHDQHNSNAQTAHKPTRPTLLGNPNQILT